MYLLIAMFSRSALLLWLAASLVPALKAQTENWVQVRTPHFLGISNAAESDARKAAHS